MPYHAHPEPGTDLPEATVTIPLSLFSRLAMVEGFARSFIAAHRDQVGSAEIRAARELGLASPDED